MNDLIMRKLAGCLVAISFIVYAYRGGPVRFGTEPMPEEGRIIIGICGLAMFAHFLKQAVIIALR